MQNQYVADVGDYIKLALLRQLQPGHLLGVVWWLFPDEAQKGDGRHISYLKDSKWAGYDPDLFAELMTIVATGRREIESLENHKILPEASFFRETIPKGGRERLDWLSRAQKSVGDADVVFLDPDNGLEPRSFSPGRNTAGKSVSYQELAAFKAPGRTIVAYHHQTRAKGGHLKEIEDLSSRLREHFDRVDAVRAKPFSPRVFFLLDATDDLIQRMEEMCAVWKGHLFLNPHLG